HRTGHRLGGCAVSFDAFSGKDFWQRLPGWNTRTTAINSATGLSGGARQTIGALVGFRSSTGDHRAGAWTSVRFVGEYSVDCGRLPFAGNAGAEPDRSNWRGAYVGLARRSEERRVGKGGWCGCG